MRNCKRFCFSLVFLFVFATSFCDTLTIMSFNLNGTNSSHRMKEKSRWAEDIAAIISQANADIVLLQEVSIELDKRLDTEYFKNPKKDNVLDFFIRELKNGKWEYCTSADYILRKNMSIDGRTYKSGNKTQNNAVLYNESKLKANDQKKMLNFDTFKDSKYKFDKNSVQVIEFEERATRQKFIVMNVHLPYSDIDSYTKDLDTLERLYASQKLKMGVIVGGDFNTHREALTKRNFDNVDGTTNWYYNFNFGLLTTIAVRNSKTFAFANAYDHFIYNKKIKEEKITQRVAIPTKDTSLSHVKIGNNTFYNSKDFYNRVSDHYPIVFEFSVIN